MNDPKVQKLADEIRHLSEEEMKKNGAIEAHIGVAGATPKLAGAFEAAVAKLPESPAAAALADATLGGKAYNRTYQAKANPYSFARLYDDFLAYLKGIQRQVREVARAQGNTAEVRAVLSAYDAWLASAESWRGDVEKVRAEMPQYEAIIREKDKKQEELNAYVRQHPELAKGDANGYMAKQTRFNRVVRYFRYGRVFTDDGTPPNLDPKKTIGWAGLYGFYFGNGGLDGCKSAADVVHKLALQYSGYIGKSLVGYEFEAAVSFADAAGAEAPPPSQSAWLSLLNRLSDTNHTPGQESSGGGSTEKVLLNPVLGDVRLVAIRHFPHAPGATDAQRQKDLDAQVAQHQKDKLASAHSNAQQLNAAGRGAELKARWDKLQAEEKELDARLAGTLTVGERHALLERKKAMLTERNELHYRAEGRFDPEIRRQLTAVELALAEKAVHGAANAEEKARLTEQKRQVLSQRDLQAARDSKGRMHASVMLQAHSAGEVTTVANHVSGHEDHTAYVRTPDEKGTVDSGSASRSADAHVSGTQLTYGVEVNQRKREQSASSFLNPVDVKITAGGTAGVFPESPNKVALRAGMGAKTAAVRAAASLPVAQAAPQFPDIIGKLVFSSVDRMFSRTAALVHHADKHEQQQGGKGRAPGADPLAGFSKAFFKRKGEGLADDVARRRELRALESRFGSGIARMESAAHEARPLVSPQAQQLEAALGRLDAQIAALKGLRGEALAHGSRAVGQTLGEMASIARGMGYQSAGTLRALQGRINSRREELARLASGLSPEGKATVADHKRLDALGRQVPGLDKVVGERHPDEKRGKGGKPGQHGQRGKGEKPGHHGEHPDHHPQHGAQHDAHHDDKHGLARVGGSGKQALGKGRRRTPLGMVGGPRASKHLALTNAHAAYSRKGNRGLADLVAPGAVQAISELPKQVNNIFEELRRKGHQPRAKLFGISLPKVHLPSLASIKHAVTNVVTHNPIAQAVNAATNKVGALAHAVANSDLGKGLRQVVGQGIHKAAALAHAVANNATNAVKKTAHVLGQGMRQVGSNIAHAAHNAWDASKHAIRATGNFVAHQYQSAKGAASHALHAAGNFVSHQYQNAKHAASSALHAAGNYVSQKYNGAKHWVQTAAQKTGHALSGAWHKATGVVGAMGGAIKRGISHVAPYVMSGAKALGGFLLKTNPLLNGMYQLAKKYGPSVKSLAASAWGGIKKFGAATGHFLQSPAGQLLTTGLSIAATFIPGGILVKAGVGAIIGAIEAVSKGGGLKEALMGAAMGGLEGAVPFLKLGLAGKVGLGAIKGGLSAAVNGEGLGGIAKGAFGGVFDMAGGSIVKRFGGGKGVKALEQFMTGASEHKGALGALQRFASKGGIQKLYAAGKKFAPKVVKGAVWAYDKTGKLHSLLEKGHKLGEGIKGGLEGLHGGAHWLAEHTGNEHLKHVLDEVSEYSEKGAKGLESPLEYVKKVDGYVEKTHDAIGHGLSFVGVNKNKAVKEMHRRQELQRKLGDKNPHKPGLLDRTDNFFAKLTRVDERKKKAEENKGKKSLLDTQLGRLKGTLARSETGRKVLDGARKTVDFGAAAHGHLHALHEVVEKGIKAGKSIQSGLQNLAMATEGADEEQFGGHALKWINEAANEWSEKTEKALETVEKVNKGVGFVDKGLSAAVKKGGKTDADLKASEKKAGVWWGLEKAEEEEKKEKEKAEKKGKGAHEEAPEGELLAHGEHGHEGAEHEGEQHGGEHKPKTVGGAPWKKHGKDETVVAPWVKWGEKVDERKQKALGDKDHPTRLKTGLDQLDAWRKRAVKAADTLAKHDKVFGDDEATKAKFGRIHSGIRMLGGTSGDHKEEWKAYKKRHHLGEKEGKGEHGEHEGHEHEGHEGHGEHGGHDAHAGKHVQKEIAEHAGRHAEKLGETHAKEVEHDENKAKAAHEQHHKEQGTEDELPIAEPPLHGKKQDDELPIAEPPLHGKGKQDDELPIAEPPLHGKQQDDGELPIPSLQQMTDAEGVVGGKHTAAPGLPGALGDNPFDIGLDGEPGMGGHLGPGAQQGAAPEDDTIFGRLRDLIANFEGRLATGLPQLEAQLAQGPEAGEGLFHTLLDEAQVPEAEVQRLEAIVGADPFLSKGLHALAAKLSSLRASVQMSLHKGIHENKKQDAEEGGQGAKAAPGAGPAAGAPDQELVHGDEPHAEQPQTDAPQPAHKPDPKSAPTSGKAVPQAATADDSYLGEPHEDTWIGSGAAARPIQDGLANNFKFPEKNVGGASIGGELAKLGGAISGLGGSLAGAAGDVGGIFAEVGKGAKAVGGMGAEVGELVGHKDNFLTHGADKVGKFADFVKKGAGVFEKDAKRLGGMGDKVHAFGGRWQDKGFLKAAGHEAGKLFRKGKAGSQDPQSAPTVDAGRYADAPKRLDFSVMGQMERFLGGRFGDVKIHTGTGAEAITRRFDAEAVTIREHIFFAPGRYNPHSTDGRKLLAHELTHVNQRGRPNLDTRTAEEEAHKAEALYGAPGMEILDLSQPQADFQLNTAGAEHGPAGVRTAKRTRSVNSGSGSHDDGVDGEELLDLVGERVYELMVEDLEKEQENR